MSSPGTRRGARRVIPGGLAVLAAVAFVIALALYRRDGAASGGDGRARPESVPEPSLAGDQAEREHRSQAATSAAGHHPIDLDRGVEAASGGPAAARAYVLGLCATLDQLAPGHRRAVIEEFFASGRDVRLGGRFTIGPGGYLHEWPTLRVALFDYLAQRDGAAAREIALQWLGSRPEEPAEWSLAFRELVRGRDRMAWPEIVAERMHDFLRDERWIVQGSRGWLEGFDAIVAGRATDYLADLAELAHRGDAAAASFGAFVAADRLMLAAPVETMRELTQNRLLLGATPELRAGLFARADVRSADQLGALESYLLRGDLGQSERQAFAEQFPLYDLAVSENLLSTSPRRSVSDMAQHDRAAAVAIERWLRDARFTDWHDALTATRERLEDQLARVRPE